MSLLSYDDSSLGGIFSEQVKESETSTPENADVDESDVLAEEDVQDLVVLEGEPVIPDWDIFSDDDVVNILLIGTDEHVKIRFQFRLKATVDCYMNHRRFCR